MKLTLKNRIGSAGTPCCAKSARICRPAARASALGKRPSQLVPPTEDKSVQCLVETGIRGTLAMVAAAALQLDIFSHIHWSFDDVLTGVQLAAPCIALEAGLLLLCSTLSGPSAQQQQQQQQQPLTNSTEPQNLIDSETHQSQQSKDQAAMNAALLAAMDAVYLHNIRYSLLGATSLSSRVALEAGAQVSEELLARGVLLGCTSAWLTNRFIEAGLCGDQPVLALQPLNTLSSSTAATTAELLPCGTSPEWLAAAALCCIMASRFVVHSRGKAASARHERDTAAAAAAARRAVLRYEPLAVQQAAAGGDFGSEIDAQAADLLAAGEAEAIERLAQGWLGARFVLGQACMFAAFIATDNLVASFAAGLAVQVVSSLCSERYLQRVTQTGGS